MTASPFVDRPFLQLSEIPKLTSNLYSNGVIALTRCANRKAGYGACFFLLVMGIFSKFAAALVAIPAPVLGGLTTFLFASVAVSGIRIISTVPFTRRNRFILTTALSLGYGAILVPNWFSYVFTYQGGNAAKKGFFNAIELVLETGFAVTGFLAILLNLILSEEIEDETVSITANDADAADDREEWARIQKHQQLGSVGNGAGSSKDEERGDVDGDKGEKEKGL